MHCIIKSIFNKKVGVCQNTCWYCFSNEYLYSCFNSLINNENLHFIYSTMFFNVYDNSIHSDVDQFYTWLDNFKARKVNRTSYGCVSQYDEASSDAQFRTGTPSANRITYYQMHPVFLCITLFKLRTTKFRIRRWRQSLQTVFTYSILQYYHLASRK